MKEPWPDAPHPPLPEFATRDDIAALRSEMSAEIRAEGQAIRSELEQRFAAVDRQFGELKGEIARQTLTLGLMLGSLIIATLGTMLTLGFTGAFA